MKLERKDCEIIMNCTSQCVEIDPCRCYDASIERDSNSTYWVASKTELYLDAWFRWS